MSIRKSVVLAAALGLSALSLQASAQSFTESFDTVIPAGWTNVNNSTTQGTNPTWFQGNSTVFPAQAGAGNSYAGANFNATTLANNISLWLLSPRRRSRTATR